MAACGAKILHLRCVEYARRYDMPDPRALVVQQARRAPGSADTPATASDWQRAAPWNRPSSPASRTTAARPRSPSSGVPDKVGEAARIFEALAGAGINLDMIVQNISAAATNLTDISFTPAARPTARTAMAALDRIKDEVGYASLLYDDQIGKVSLIGAGMRSHPGVTAKFFSALAARGRQHRDDLHLGDPHLGGRRRGSGRRRRAAPPTPRSTSTPTRSRPSSTEGPDDDQRRSTSASSARPARSAP